MKKLLIFDETTGEYETKDMDVEVTINGNKAIHILDDTPENRTKVEEAQVEIDQAIENSQ